MPQVGIRQLKNEASEIMRAVREDGAEHIVTYRGKPVAVILPIDETMRSRSAERIVAETREHTDYWARLDALAAKIDTAWTSEKTIEGPARPLQDTGLTNLTCAAYRSRSASAL